MDAYETNVRPALAEVRRDLGVPEDPVEAFRAGGYAEQRVAERGTSSVESAYETA